MCREPISEPSFEEVYEEVSWELCVEAASMAATELTITVCDDVGKPAAAPRSVKTLEEGVDMLLQTKNGGLRIKGSWKACGKRGDIELVYVRLLSPTATETFIVRFLNESIRLKIAKQLMQIKNPGLELQNDSGENPNRAS